MMNLCDEHVSQSIGIASHMVLVTASCTLCHFHALIAVFVMRFLFAYYFIVL